MAGVFHPHTGTIIEVRSVSAQGDFKQVRPAKDSQVMASDAGNGTSADDQNQLSEQSVMVASQLFLPIITNHQ